MTRNIISKRLSMFAKPEEQEQFTGDKLDKKLKEFSNILCDEIGMSKLKPCDLQYYLLTHIEDIDELFNGVDDLKNLKN